MKSDQSQSTTSFGTCPLRIFLPRMVRRTKQAIRFLRNLDARHQRRHLAATLIQCISRGLAGRRRVHRLRCSRVEHVAAQKVQMMARGWLGRRQAWQRSVLTKWGACALCCSRLAEMYFEVTEQVKMLSRRGTRHKTGKKRLSS